MLEDYRAGVGIDRADEEADPAAGGVSPARSSSCRPTVEQSTGLRGGHSIGFGHHMAEEAPDDLAVVLITLLRVR
jgi:haloacetate dehalogenase